MESISNLCRICFGLGDYCLLEYKVKMPTDQSGDYEEQELFVTANEMLQLFSKNQNIELTGEPHTIQLICKICIDELIAGYMFFRKVAESDQKLAEFLQNVDSMDTELDNEQTTVEYLDEQSDDDNIQEEKSPTDTEELKIDYDVDLRDYEITQDTTNLMTAETESTDNKQQSNTFPSSPIVSPAKFADTVSDTHRTEKRARIREKQPQPLLEQGSFVVTQFVPSTTQIQMDTLYGNDDQLQGNSEFAMTCNELRTMDYALVEIESSADLHINETDSNVSHNNTLALSNQCATANNFNSQPVYVCKYCPQAFAASHFLITHVRKSHVCKFCTRAFIKTSDLYAHIRSEHNEHKCAICSKELSTHSNLRSHIKRVHGVKLPAQVALLDFRRRVVPETPCEQQIKTTLDVMDENIECYQDELEEVTEQQANVEPNDQFNVAT